ncbi:MAG: hypothetical protein ACFFCI_02400 [Promethearchaeota archaeon]
MSFPGTSFSFQPEVFRAQDQNFIIISGIFGIGSILISFISTLFKKLRLSITFGSIGCSLIGLNLMTYLFMSYFVSLSPSLWFYLNFLIWIGFCTITIALVRSKEDFFNPFKISLRKNKEYLNTNTHLQILRFIYLLFIIVFLLSILLPFEHIPGDAPSSGYSGIHVLSIGGIEGLVLILVSISYLAILKLKKTVIYGFIGFFIIGINFSFFIPFLGRIFMPSIGFYLSFIAWMSFLIINAVLLRLKA